MLSAILNLVTGTSVIWVPILVMSVLSQKMMAWIGRRAVLTLGIIGVPCHELSHAIMIIIFRYKITTMAMYSPSDDGSLGFVNFQYRKSWFSPMALLLIGLAPLIGGWLAFTGLTMILRPDLMSYISNAIGEIHTATQAWQFIYQFTQIILRTDNYLKTIVWMLCGFSLLLFCVPSKADFNGCKKGMLVLLVGYVVWVYLYPVQAVGNFNAIIPMLAVIAAPMYIGLLIIIPIFAVFKSQSLAASKLIE